MAQTEMAVMESFDKMGVMSMTEMTVTEFFDKKHVWTEMTVVEFSDIEDIIMSSTEMKEPRNFLT